VAPNARDLLTYCNKTIEEADYIVLHQANKLINESIRKKLKVPEEKLPYTIHKYGNTSCASIPITMVAELQKELKTRYLRMLLSGFGVGLSWGSVWLETDNVVVPDVIDL
jgi:3-oxoacyl-[acyl-carrier-protein] synthase-3